MSTIDDLRIQNDCAHSHKLTGKGLSDRGHAMEAGYFARENADKLRSLKENSNPASIASEKSACENCDCTCSYCDCKTSGTCFCTDACGDNCSCRV